MKRMEMTYRVVFESDEDLENYEDFNGAVKNGDIKLSVMDITVFDENGDVVEIDVDPSELVDHISNGF
jgi:hypothetical protein